jgi:hypothetical protein
MSVGDISWRILDRKSLRLASFSITLKTLNAAFTVSKLHNLTIRPVREHARPIATFLEMRITMKNLALLTIVLTSTTFAALTGVENRTHYVVADKLHTPGYYVTAITRTAETDSSQIYLIKNAATGQHIRVDITRDFRKHETVAHYSLDNKPAVTVRMQLPFVSAKTIHETNAENKQHAELREQDIPVTIESSGHSEKTTEKNWRRGPDAGNDHERARKAVDPNLSSVITQVIPVLSFPQLSGACSTVGFVTDDAKCAGDARLLIAEVVPDCAFDAELGVPCTADHLSKEKDARSKGRTGRY